MARGYATAPCDLFREHIGLNESSFSGTNDSDLFRETANIAGTPSRPTHAPDATAYGTQPVTDSWRSQLRGDTKISLNANSGQGNAT